MDVERSIIPINAIKMFTQNVNTVHTEKIRNAQKWHIKEKKLSKWEEPVSPSTVFRIFSSDWTLYSWLYKWGACTSFLRIYMLIECLHIWRFRYIGQVLVLSGKVSIFHISSRQLLFLDRLWHVPVRCTWSAKSANIQSTCRSAEKRYKAPLEAKNIVWSEEEGRPSKAKQALPFE